MSEGEIWKDVHGYEGLYKVSNKGNVYSVRRLNSRGRKCGGRMVKPRHHVGGYLRVSLYENGIKKDELVHRLVLEAFVDNPNNLPEVNHLDEDKTNNELSNLEWCTREYNNNHGTRTERVTQIQSRKVKGVNVENGEIIRFKSTMEAGRNGYSSGAVSEASRGVYKDGRTGKLIGGGRIYRGHRWYYEEDVAE